MSCFVEVPFILSDPDGQAGQPEHPVTLYLMVAVSANATIHPILRTNATNVSAREQATRTTMAQDSIGTTPSVVATVPEPLLPRMDRVPIETSTAVPAMSHAKNALTNADKATEAINLTSTWEGAVARIKWVMDTVSPVAGVRRRAMSF